jgi:hypothetical protein
MNYDDNFSSHKKLIVINDDYNQVIITIFLNNIINIYFNRNTTFNDLDFNNFINLCIRRYGIFNHIRRYLLDVTETRELHVIIDSHYTYNKLIPFIIYCLPMICSRENLKLTYLQLYYPIPKKINNISLYNTNNLIHIFFLLGRRDNKKDIFSYTTILNYLNKIEPEIESRREYLLELSKNIPFFIIQDNIIPFLIK